MQPTQAIDYIHAKYGYENSMQVIQADQAGAIFAPSFDPRYIAPSHDDLEFLQGVYKNLVTTGKE